MDNFLLTQNMIERELKMIAKYKFSMPAQILDRISLALRYATQTDNLIMLIIYNGEKRVELGLFDKDLHMSLDDFSDHRLIPALTRLADNIGYATWD